MIGIDSRKKLEEKRSEIRKWFKDERNKNLYLYIAKRISKSKYDSRREKLSEMFHNKMDKIYLQYVSKHK